MLRTRRVGGPSPPIERDPDLLTPYLEDASGHGPGAASGLVRPADETGVAGLLEATFADAVPILCQGARSSLTGGAVPRGDVVLSLEHCDAIGPIERRSGGATVRVGAGVHLDELRRRLGASGLDYPPVPTWQQATVGGTVATNAGGAATFRYGVTRAWVRGLSVVLSDGELLEVERGEARVRPGESFRLGRADGSERIVPATVHRLPPLKKLSAGYWAADPLDLVDLFVGAEGTLGVVTSVVLDVVPRAAGLLTALAFVDDFAVALALAGALREAAIAARSSGDPRGPDVRSIEFADRRCLELLREAGEDRRLRIAIPETAGAAVVIEVELPEAADDAIVQERLFDAIEGRGGPDEPVGRFARILLRHAPAERVELAVGHDAARRSAILDLREAVPRRVNELLAERRRTVPGLRKLGGDPIVPFAALPDLAGSWRDAFGSRGLDHAVWGHLSDGNVHPNVLPRTAAEVEAGIAALLEVGGAAMRLGGGPLSEHGVGRDPLKHELLRRFVGDAAIAGMRAVKRALDPPGRLARGVLFPS